MIPQPQQQEIKSWSGAYIMYIKEGNVVITGANKFKNFKAVFPIPDVRDLVDTPPAPDALAAAYERGMRESSSPKHDAAIAARTLEEVLDELEEGIRKLPQTHFASVMDLIQSLRQQEAQR